MLFHSGSKALTWFLSLLSYRHPVIFPGKFPVQTRLLHGDSGMGSAAGKSNRIALSPLNTLNDRKVGILSVNTCIIPAFYEDLRRGTLQWLFTAYLPVPLLVNSLQAGAGGFVLFFRCGCANGLHRVEEVLNFIDQVLKAAVRQVAQHNQRAMVFGVAQEVSIITVP